MSDGLVLTEDENGVRTLTLHRPDQLNAFDQAMCAALADALLAAELADTTKVVVLTGAGDAFSAGTDLKELAASGDFRRGPDNPRAFDDLIDRFVAFPKPLLCAVNGVAVGIGATMLGLVDLVFMADTARLKCPFTSLALAPEAASSVTLPMLIGRQNATWMLLSSEWIDATDAAAMGMVWKVVPANDLLNVTGDHARRLAAQSMESLVASKRLITATFAQAVADGRDRENLAFDALLAASASRAAVGAFVAERSQTRRE